MISNVNFTGREGMLNQAFRSVDTSFKDYISAGKVYSKTEELAAKAKAEIVNTFSNKQNPIVSYVVSHGTPATIARDFDVII